MKNKKLIIILIVIVALAIACCCYFITRTIKKNNYQSADEYTVKNTTIPSIKAVLGEKKIKNYKYSKNGDIETLELTIIDDEDNIDKYLDAVKETGNYIELRQDNENIRAISAPGNNGDIPEVRMEKTNNGYILTIISGPGTMEAIVEE